MQDQCPFGSPTALTVAHILLLDRHQHVEDRVPGSFGMEMRLLTSAGCNTYLHTIVYTCIWGTYICICICIWICICICICICSCICKCICTCRHCFVRRDSGMYSGNRILGTRNPKYSTPYPPSLPCPCCVLGVVAKARSIKGHLKPCCAKVALANRNSQLTMKQHEHPVYASWLVPWVEPLLRPPRC